MLCSLDLREKVLKDFTYAQNDKGQAANFCPRCHSAGYTIARVEPDGSEVRICSTCHQEYKNRKWARV